MNLPRLKDFSDSFFASYRTALKREDLFNTKYVVGGGCGYSNTPTELLVELVQVPDNRKILKLNEWLTSACIEKQLMAIWGLYSFKQIFPQITSEQKRLIELIKQKKGAAKVCYGCSYTSSKICDIIERIESGKGI